MISYLVADCKTAGVEILEEVVLPHSRMAAGLDVHRALVEVVPLTVRGVPRSPFEL